MAIYSETLNLTTAAGGGVTGTTKETITGTLKSVSYVADATAPYTTPNFTISTEKTNQNIWTEVGVSAAATKYPRASTHDQATPPAVRTYDATREVGAEISIAGERIEVVIAAGGAAKVGSFRFTWEE